MSSPPSATLDLPRAVCAPNTGLKFSEKITFYDMPIPGLYMTAMPHLYPDERSTNNSIWVAAATVEAMGLDSSFIPPGLNPPSKYA